MTASASIKNPQTFNRYSYALNSPYKFVDPLGLAANVACAGSSLACQKDKDAQETSQRAQEDENKKRKGKKGENESNTPLAPSSPLDFTENVLAFSVIWMGTLTINVSASGDELTQDQLKILKGFDVFVTFDEE